MKRASWQILPSSPPISACKTDITSSTTVEKKNPEKNATTNPRNECPSKHHADACHVVKTDVSKREREKRQTQTNDQSHSLIRPVTTIHHHISTHHTTPDTAQPLSSPSLLNTVPIITPLKPHHPLKPHRHPPPPSPAEPPGQPAAPAPTRSTDQSWTPSRQCALRHQSTARQTPRPQPPRPPRPCSSNGMSVMIFLFEGRMTGAKRLLSLSGAVLLPRQDG